MMEDEMVKWLERYEREVIEASIKQINATSKDKTVPENWSRAELMSLSMRKNYTIESLIKQAGEQESGATDNWLGANRLEECEVDATVAAFLSDEDSPSVSLLAGQ